MLDDSFLGSAPGTRILNPLQLFQTAVLNIQLTDRSDGHTK